MDPNAASKLAHRHRAQLVISCAVTDLAVVIHSKHIKRTGTGSNGRVLITSRDKRDSRYPRKLDWTSSLRTGAVTKLAVRILSPHPDGSIRFQREIVINAGRNGGDSGQAWNLNRRQPVREIRTQTNLSVGVVSPSPDSTIRLQRERMSST